MGGFGIFIKCIVGYSDLEVASCHRIGGFNIFYKVYCRIYCSRCGFMPHDGKFQCFFINCILGYIEVEVASYHRIGGFSIFIKCILGYREVEVASCHRIGGLNICITFIVGHIEVEVASCPSNRRDKYIYKIRCRIY